MMDKQSGQMVYRLLSLGCFLAWRPVVDVAGVRVALSVPGPMRFQRKGSRGSCWRFGAGEQNLFKLWVVLNLFFMKRASSGALTLSCCTSEVSDFLLSKKLLVDLLSLLLIKHCILPLVFAKSFVFPDNIRGRRQHSIIMHFPPCLRGPVFWFCHMYIHVNDASITLPLSLRIYVFVLFIQRLLWSLWLKRNYFHDFWLWIPCFAAIFLLLGPWVFYFPCLIMPRVTLSSGPTALGDKINSQRSFKGLGSLCLNCVLILTMPRISVDHCMPQFVRWRPISIFLNDIPP